MPAKYISEQEYRQDVHRVSQYLTRPVRVARTVLLFFLYGTLLPLGAVLFLACLYTFFQKGN